MRSIHRQSGEAGCAREFVIVLRNKNNETLKPCKDRSNHASRFGGRERMPQSDPSGREGLLDLMH